jgi:hypothetical protein
MTAENCREWRESLGAYALGQLGDDERTGLEAHLEGCAECRAELESLRSVVKLLPLADPQQLGTVPSLPRGLGDRVMASIAGERRTRTRRRRRRGGFALAGAAAAVAAALLAIFFIGGDEEEAPSTHLSFRSAPQKLKIGATLEPRAFGTEIHVYVKGARSGALCRVFLRSEDGTRTSAGSFRYRWGDDSYPILTAALDLEQTDALGIQVGDRTFIESLENAEPS